MSTKAERQIRPANSLGAPKAPIDVYADNRAFERFLCPDSNALRPDQRGSYYPHELRRFRR